MGHAQEEARRQVASLGGREAILGRAGVTREEWWVGANARGIDSYRSRVNGWPKDRQLTEEPAKKKSDVALIGVDAQERLVFARTFWPVNGEDRVSGENLHVWEGDVVSMFHFDREWDLELRATYMVRWQMQDGRPVSYEMLKDEGWVVVSTFAYDKLGRRERQDNPALGDDHYTFEHDAAGGLVRIERYSRGARQVVFEKKAKTVGLPALMKTIDERLRAAIPAVLGKLRLTDPVFCLALVYELEQGEVLPPRIALGEDAYRAKFDAPEHLWNPAEWKLFDVPALEFDDPVLGEACRAANQLLADSGKIDSARKLLATLAAELPASAYAGLPVTDDFVVLALHGDDTELGAKDRKALEKRMPADVRKTWKTRGWL